MFCKKTNSVIVHVIVYTKHLCIHRSRNECRNDFILSQYSGTWSLLVDKREKELIKLKVKYWFITIHRIPTLLHCTLYVGITNRHETGSLFNYSIGRHGHGVRHSSRTYFHRRRQQFRVWNSYRCEKNTTQLGFG